MTGAPSSGEEGAPAPRRGPTGAPPQDASGASASRMGGGSVPSEGSSSNQQKETMQSTLESSADATGAAATVPTETPQETPQNFTNESRLASVLPMSSSGLSVTALPTTNQTGSEPRKRAHKSAAGKPKRRTQPKLSNRDGASSGSSSCLPQQQQPSSSTDSMVMPPLLGIPPGCVPPIGSNGQAIGMPFLNQHPFVPSGPMNISSNTFGVIPPFIYGHPGDPDMMGGGGGSPSASFDANLFASCPFPPHFPHPPATSTPQQPSPAVNPPTPPSKEPSLQRVSSTPNAMSAPIIPEMVAVASDEAPDSPSRRALHKSPSLVNF